MATTNVKYMISFLMSFLSFMIVTFPVANAIPARDVDKLCNETPEVAFCLEQIGKDPQIAAARDLSDVLLIAIKVSKMQVDKATIHIDSVRQKFSGPNGRRRLGACKTNYGIAEARFKTASEQVRNKSFWEVAELAKIGANAVVDCENGWRRDGPIQTSPLTYYNMNVFKLSGIIALIIQKLLS